MTIMRTGFQAYIANYNRRRKIVQPVKKTTKLSLEQRLRLNEISLAKTEKMLKNDKKLFNVIIEGIKNV